MSFGDKFGLRADQAARETSGLSRPQIRRFSQDLLRGLCLRSHQVVVQHAMPTPCWFGCGCRLCDGIWTFQRTSGRSVVEKQSYGSFGGECREGKLAAGGTDDRPRKSKFVMRITFNPISRNRIRSFRCVIRYLHRCAASVIEAKRLLARASRSSLQSPEESFQNYAAFCQALRIPAVGAAWQRPLLTAFR